MSSYVGAARVFARMHRKYSVCYVAFSVMGRRMRVRRLSGGGQ
jgi:hypothetical protein